MLSVQEDSIIFNQLFNYCVNIFVTIIFFVDSLVTYIVICVVHQMEILNKYYILIFYK